MSPMFVLVKGANSWRVLEWYASTGGVVEYRYATESLKTKGEAMTALLRFQAVAKQVGRKEPS